MSNGKISCYIDIASFYSYVAFADLRQQQDLLAAHGVEVEFIPVLIGGINNKSGNKPPWTLPAKASYGLFDAKRSAERVGLAGISMPEDLMSRSLTILPLRALHFIKSTYSRQHYYAALHYFFHCFWTPPHRDLTKPDVFQATLAETPSSFAQTGGMSGLPSPMFTPREVEEILRGATSPECKDALKKTTDDAVEKGAFGAPWIWAKNSLGEEEPFFGSDRFHFIYRFLGLPHNDIKLLPPSSGENRAKGSKL